MFKLFTLKDIHVRRSLRLPKQVRDGVLRTLREKHFLEQAQRLND